MIDVYFWTTPNGYKVTILLEELGWRYNVIPVNIGKGEQFASEFLKISPNNRIPAVVDHEGPDGRPIAIFESGAIMMYLAEKAGWSFMPQETRPAVQRGLAVMKEEVDRARQSPPDKASWDILFGKQQFQKR